jgi:hypothetical protein
MFSIAANALDLTTRAKPHICSDIIGFLLCGIAEDPFWPLEKNSSASNTSVRCK